MDAVEIALEETKLLFKDINKITSQGCSEIQKFYQDSVIFVTGANGFMGKLLVEKLLRACKVKKIFILLRGKKEKTILQRLNDMKSDPIFDYLRETQPDFGDKIVAVEGDVTSIRLGICDQDWRILIEEVDTIFHLAATTRFNEALAISTSINVRGTREALHLAKQCQHLRVFVHVSTAYCSATTDKIGVLLNEEFYPCPVPPDTLINLAETLDASRIEAITPQLIERWPNTYTFTKAVAEELVRNMAEVLPICIIRPPIVICPYNEPIGGWLDMSCVFGPTGNILTMGLGIKHLTCVNINNILCLVPGDYVNNTILAAAWDCVNNKASGDREVKIYTASSTKCEVRFSTIHNDKREVLRKYATSKAVGYCTVMEIESKLLYRILSWFLHYIPAYIIDLCIFACNISLPKGVTSLVNVYKKMDKLELEFHYFLKHNWSFDDKNVVELHQKMSPTDRKIFNVDVTTINWDHLILNWVIGTKKYILKDSKLTDDYAIKKQTMFKVAHYTLIFVYLYVFYYIFSLAYSCFK